MEHPPSAAAMPAANEMMAMVMFMLVSCFVLSRLHLAPGEYQRGDGEEREEAHGVRRSRMSQSRSRTRAQHSHGAGSLTRI